MEFNQDQIAAIIGAKELEIINLRMQLVQALARLKELEPKPPSADVVPIKEAS